MAVRGSSRFGPLSNPLKGQLCGCTGSARSGQLFFLFLNLRRIFGLYPKGIFVLFLDKNEQTNDGKRRKTTENEPTLQHCHRHIAGVSEETNKRQKTNPDDTGEARTSPVPARTSRGRRRGARLPLGVARNLRCMGRDCLQCQFERVDDETLEDHVCRAGPE